MTKNLTAFVTLMCFFLNGCSESTAPRYFDYSGKDGCTPPNIGHRLGGDLEQYKDNSIEGLHGIESQQNSSCFKNWEFDLTESGEGLVLLNFSQYSGSSVSRLTLDELPDGVVVVSQLLREFSRINVSKPIIIDLKEIKSP